jgi:hypothetical protein
MLTLRMAEAAAAGEAAAAAAGAASALRCAIERACAGGRSAQTASRSGHSQAQLAAAQHVCDYMVGISAVPVVQLPQHVQQVLDCADEAGLALHIDLIVNLHTVAIAASCCMP